MPNVETISVALSSDMVAQLREAVSTGQYASSSEVVRDALRDWTEKHRLRPHGVLELRQLWDEARADSSPGLDPEEVFDELERKYGPMAEAADADKAG